MNFYFIVVSCVSVMGEKLSQLGSDKSHPRTFQRLSCRRAPGAVELEVVLEPGWYCDG